MADHKQEFGQELPTFVARLWLEPGPDGTAVWRGRVKHVQSDREAYFRSFEQLGAFLTEVSGKPGPLRDSLPGPTGRLPAET
jgi:hypothetical protein